MKKRAICIGNYDSALYGWTLSSCVLADAEQKTNFVEKPFGDGSWDMSTVLTDGIPKYKTRPLDVTLECSEGTRDERLELIGHLVNTLDGLEHKIVLPDYPNHYIIGRVQVAMDYCDMAHCAVKISAVCQPWIYRSKETVVTATAAAAAQTMELRNTGRLAVAPTVTISGENAEVLLRYGTDSLALPAGSYVPGVVLTPGVHKLQYSGSGNITISYREAVLR